ncbi:unnamed protein product, partial [Musa hybrid cultivar]
LPLFDFLAAHAVSVRVLLCSGQSPVDDDVLARLPALELLVASSAGVDHIDLAACRRLGISVTNAGSAFTDDAADYAVGLLINILHHISASDRYVRRGLWLLKGDYPLASKVIHLPTSCQTVQLLVCLLTSTNYLQLEFVRNFQRFNSDKKCYSSLIVTWGRKT